MPATNNAPLDAACLSDLQYSQPSTRITSTSHLYLDSHVKHFLRYTATIELSTHCAIMASTSTPKNVLIIGGSLAGLMHALVLLSLPNSPDKITILERSPTNLLHNQGAGIVAGPEVQQFFSEYVRAGGEIAIASKLRHYLKKDGTVIPESVERREQRMTSWDLLYHLLRWRVEGLRSEYVKGLKGDERPKAEYVNGCTVTGVEDAGKDGVEITWQQKDAGESSEVVDLVIAADGASSTVRKLLRPEVERKYAGYVAWRGTVPERQLSDEAKEVFVEKFTFYYGTGTQTLGYLIPGKDGTMGPGRRLFNWVWYVNYQEVSEELEELMTDTNGKRHAITLPVGLMQPQVWEKQKAHAAKALPPQYAEAVAKTEQPFIQAITDVISPENSFFDGKVLLVGDALAGFRPHTAASTGQAAFDALQLGKLYGGGMTKQEYNSAVLGFAARLQKAGVVMGERSQFGQHPLAG
ncbi:2,6-dihydroxypyridine 3-monooxygenase [Fulvia fulva]|uniref:2,6-dihydroxypyridine 3-monooxygenase n=1 Tax=Passalora fulva TaxID=5499 RepID=A0A9Q8LAY2_PASFU|nr:2,6-dihydroxypyridine 3-monooxygenase [Fulvia fulva]UJO14037.1 2,6-dihydroxypyridine 3-monooxygenase [Fulvia fulva]